MWIFWIVAGLLAAAAAAAVLARARSAALTAAAGGEDPSVALYRRQLAELDDLAVRGLLGEAELRGAHAEAGRRLLAAADAEAPQEQAGGRGARLAVMAAIAVAVLGALGLYLAIGSPGDPDQPFRARLAAWRARPDALGPAEMAAVLKTVVVGRPTDPRARTYLGRAELAAGDADAAAEDFRKAAALSPGDADLQTLLGEALAASADGGAAPEAEAAFRRALAIDPKNLGARYLLARTQIAGGRRDEGTAGLKALQAELPPGDPRRALIDTDLAQAAQPTGPAAAAVAGAPPAEQAAFIRSMVDGLAQRLQAKPDDPDGWARLIRAYKVLGDKPALAKALDRARKLYAGRPADLARIEAEAH